MEAKSSEKHQNKKYSRRKRADGSYGKRDIKNQMDGMSSFN